MMTTKKAAAKKKTAVKTAKKAVVKKVVVAKKIVAKKTAAKKAGIKAPPMRYAHPFFTTTPVAERPMTVFGRRMTDFIVQNLDPIPTPRVSPPIMTLASVIGAAGAAEINATGTIHFHAVGDTGRHGGSTQEEAVATQMGKDYVAGQSATNPAFLFHMGDVIYDANKDVAYRDAFYRPFIDYPGKIIAIPGNHDGETFPKTDPVSLEAFESNFCLPTAEVPPIAQGAGILRVMVPQPAAYWWLQDSLFDLIALYSNIGEGQGDLTDGKGDQQQITFLTNSLKTIAAARKKSGIRKALLIATHHPSFSTGGHTGSVTMLAQIDAVCKSVGIVPHLMMSGHAHSYQRYTRTNTITSTPATTTFLVAGTGGYGLQPVSPATGTGTPVYNKAISAYGYLALTITAIQIKATFWQVPAGAVTPFDSVTIPV
jgi:hypothetical protein